MPKENSYRDRRLDRRMRIVADEREILEPEIVDVLDRRDSAASAASGRHSRAELFARLLEMVLVKMQIAESVDEFARFEIADLRDHHREQRIGGDVEGHAEKKIRAALVKLAAQLAILHVELKKHVARRQRHSLQSPPDSTRSRSVAGCPGFVLICAMTLSI